MFYNKQSHVCYIKYTYSINGSLWYMLSLWQVKLISQGSSNSLFPCVSVGSPALKERLFLIGTMLERVDVIRGVASEVFH